ncbi:MAG: hypothetical protein DWQ07_00705 [Chloroflexi bacterium]|nr:MAG: hypothetical protein DWQ07_00705 [Chloroflexota bacterium]MBL1195852.1 hypothetical protein [Chloroflexota bacterium]NOH13144.1 hypothetical protein [Chloroflexota bacterium]
MAEIKSSLVKPTLDTKFHIDFDWWKENDREYRVHLRSLLPDDLEARFDEINEDELLDWVDPDTAEVHQVDGLQHLLISEVAQREDFLGEHTAMVEAIFRVLLKNGNAAMSVQEIGDQLERDSKHILRTLSGQRVYRGIRPILEG